MVKLCMGYIETVQNLADRTQFIETIKSVCDKKIFLEVNPNPNPNPNLKTR